MIMRNPQLEPRKRGREAPSGADCSSCPEGLFDSSFSEVPDLVVDLGVLCNIVDVLDRRFATIHKILPTSMVPSTYRRLQGVEGDHDGHRQVVEPLEVWIFHNSLMAGTYPCTVSYMRKRSDLCSPPSPTSPSPSSSSPPIHSALGFILGPALLLRHETSSSPWRTTSHPLSDKEEELTFVDPVSWQGLDPFRPGGRTIDATNICSRVGETATVLARL